MELQLEVVNVLGDSDSESDQEEDNESTGRDDGRILVAGRISIMIVQFIEMIGHTEYYHDDESYALYVRVLAWYRAVMALFSEFSSTLTRQNIPRHFWMYNRGPGLDHLLLHTYIDQDFKKRMRISRATFQHLCHQLGPLMVRQDTKFSAAVPVETKIMIGLSRLATDDTLRGIVDSYRVGFTTAQQAILEFASSINIQLKSFCINWPTPNKMKSLAESFEQIQGIPFVIGAVDGSHIPIIAPSESAQEYYNRKGFHSILLQLIVSRDCLVWDFDIGWPGSIYDWTLFQRSAGGERIINGCIAPYCLVGDAAYPPRDYMLSPFKSHKDGLSREEYYWNYVQSSTRMPMEQTFGHLKCRWRILLKRNDMDLENVVQVVSACLVPHNLCIIHGDGFDQNWLEEAKEELQQSIAHEQYLLDRAKNKQGDKGKGGKKKHVENMRYCQYGMYKIQGTSLTIDEAVERNMDEAPFALQSHNVTNADAFRRNAISRALFEKKTTKLLQRGGVVDDDSSDESCDSGM